MKLFDVYSLCDFCYKYLDSALPARASFAIAKFVVDSEKDIALYTKKREELVRKYSKETSIDPAAPGSLNFKIDRENYPAFEKEMNDLNNTEIDIHFQLHYEDLEPLRLTPREVAKILPYVE